MNRPVRGSRLPSIRAAILAIGLIGTLGPAPLASAQPPAAAANDPAWQTLDSAFIGGQVLLRGSVRVSAPAWLLLDTGSPITIIDESLAADAKVDVATSRPKNARGEEGASVRSASDVPFRLGPLDYTARQVRVGTLDEHFSKFIGRRVSGVLGSAFFAQYVVQLDYGAKQVRVRPIVGFVYEDKQHIVPLGVVSGLPLVMASVTPAGGQPVGMLLLLDTGLSSALNADSRWARLQGLPLANQRTRKVWQVSPEESSEGTTFRLGELDLGGITFQNVPTTSGDHPIYRTLGAAGVLGSEVLSRFTVTFDYMRQRVILEPGKEAAGPFNSTLAGFGVRLEGQNNDSVRVDGVDTGSPADQAGIRVGDILLSVGTSSTADLAPAELGEVWRASIGKPIAIRVKRGESTVELTLVPRPYE